MKSFARNGNGNMSRHSGFGPSRLSWILLLLLFALSATARAQNVYYRFALPNPAVTCTTSGGNPAAVTMSTPVEWNGLPAGASINAYSILNGVSTLSGNYPVPVGSGSQAFAGVTYVGPSFPFSAGIRYDTLVNGAVVYRSTLMVACTAVGVPGTSQIVNGAVTVTVPALSSWGLAALVLVIALLAAGTMRPRVRNHDST